jgi:hypothetical protein
MIGLIRGFVMRKRVILAEMGDFQEEKGRCSG